MAPKKAAEPVVEKEEVKYTGGRVFNAEDEPLLNEIMNQYMFIPPVLIAWSIGFIDDQRMLMVAGLMGLPLATTKAVEALGGRGAFAPKSAAPAAGAKKGGPVAKPEEKWYDVFMLPTSVWIAPITLVFFAQEGFTDNYAFMGTLLGVYMIMVILQATMKKMGLLKDMKEAGEKSVKDKKDKKGKKDK